MLETSAASVARKPHICVVLREYIATRDGPFGMASSPVGVKGRIRTLKTNDLVLFLAQPTPELMAVSFRGKTGLIPSDFLSPPKTLPPKGRFARVTVPFYDNSQEDHLLIETGDVVIVYSTDLASGWWLGEISFSASSASNQQAAAVREGVKGIFPSKFVVVLHEPSLDDATYVERMLSADIEALLRPSSSSALSQSSAEAVVNKWEGGSNIEHGGGSSPNAASVATTAEDGAIGRGGGDAISTNDARNRANRAETNSDEELVHPNVAEPLLKLLLRDDDMKVFRALCWGVDVKRAEVVARCLVDLFVQNGRFMHLIDAIIDMELERTIHPATLFRDNTMSSHLMTAYCHNTGHDYILWMLKSVIICTISQPVESLEIDPDRVMNAEKLQLKQNTQTLNDVVLMFLDKITGSLSQCPPTFRYICSQLRAKVIQKFPEHKYTVIGGFFFLRFICPAIVAPDRYNIVDMEMLSGVRRPLILVSKVLQTMANGVEFGKKEPYMIPMNDFIQKNLKKVHVFFDQLANTDGLVAELEAMAAKQQGPGLRYDSRTINQVHFEMTKRSNEMNKYSLTVKSNDEAKGTKYEECLAQLQQTLKSLPPPKPAILFTSLSSSAQSSSAPSSTSSDEKASSTFAQQQQQLHSKGILNKGVFSTLRKNKGGGDGEDGGSGGGGGGLSDGGGGGLSPLHLPSLAQTVSMSGWLYLNKKTGLKGKLRPKWKKRWFKLDGSRKLRYYTKHDYEKAEGLIDLSQAQFITRCASSSSASCTYSSSPPPSSSPSDGCATPNPSRALSPVVSPRGVPDSSPTKLDPQQQLLLQIEIQTTERSYFLMATSEQDASRWVEVLNKAMNVTVTLLTATHVPSSAPLSARSNNNNIAASRLAAILQAAPSSSPSPSPPPASHPSSSSGQTEHSSSSVVGGGWKSSAPSSPFYKSGIVHARPRPISVHVSPREVYLNYHQQKRQEQQQNVINTPEKREEEHEGRGSGTCDEEEEEETVQKEKSTTEEEEREKGPLATLWKGGRKGTAEDKKDRDKRNKVLKNDKKLSWRHRRLSQSARFRREGNEVVVIGGNSNEECNNNNDNKNRKGEKTQVKHLISPRMVRNRKGGAIWREM
ncbi:Ras GTPase activating protein ira2 [Balamuthia mandrillaris]